jgi:hypothetical protein
MMSYRITKYNPDKRNAQGHYMDNSEWTAISDIDKPEYNSVTYAEYEKVETAYVDAIKAIMLDNNLKFLLVDSLELHDKNQDFKKYEETGRLKNIIVDFDKDVKILKNGLQLGFSELDKIIRLILRETVWMVLINNDFEVRFGYDYNMYVKIDSIKKSTIKAIGKNGLFVEPEFEQMIYLISDKDGNEI